MIGVDLIGDIRRAYFEELLNLDLSVQQIDGRHDTPLAHLRCG
jgi:hypothetical protein